MAIPRPSRLLLAALTVLLIAGGSMPFARAADTTAPVIRPDHQAEDLGRLLDVARERGEEIVVHIEPSGAATVNGPKPSRARTLEASALGVWDRLIDSLMAGLERGVTGIMRLPGLGGALDQKWQQDRVNATSGTDALMRIIAIVVGGLAAGLLVRRLTRAINRRWARPPGCLLDRFVIALRALLADGIGLGVYALVAFRLTNWLLPAEDFARFLARDLNHVVVSFGLYLIGARFLLAPDHPEQRLLPIRRPRWHYAMLRLYALSAVFIYATVFPIDAIGDPVALAGWYLLTSTAILGFKLWWFWFGRHDYAALAHGDADPVPIGRRLAGASASWVLGAVAVLVWWTGRLAAVSADAVTWGIAAGFTQIAVALLPILAVGADRLVADALGAETPDTTPLRQAVIAVGRTLVLGGIWVIGILMLVDAWGFYLMMLDSAPGRAVLNVAITVGVAVLTGWVAWRFAAAYLAAHAPKLRNVFPGEDEEATEPEAQSRLATALPLVRVTILGLVIGLTTLIVLSTLGLDIGPLLAGFGVIGLAISFGSQALVRDIVSGIFFMADDAFRIGEYIDTGRLKGTVEKITLRSVQLRHQSGLVHTIPFGQLQAITNASRDWATVKFNIRLERGVDLEHTRKIIKKVGQAMLADAELGGEIIQPLKLQGVADIADSAVVCRLKFTAKPARASWVQREALKRVYAALEGEGIAFASGAVTVKSADPDHPAGPPAAAAIPQRLTTEVAD